MKKIVLIAIVGILCFSMFQTVHLALAPGPLVEWSKTYGRATRNDANWANSIVQTSDGGYAIASTADFGGGEVWWLVKTDLAGNMQWNKTYPTAEQGRVFSIKQTGDGGYALAGDTYSGGLTNIARLVKTDADGNIQWDKKYTEIGVAAAFSMAQTNDGGYIVSGCKYYYDGWLMKTDADGNIQWSRSFVEANNTQLESVVETSDGGYVAVGATQYPPFSGKVDAYLVKTDADGNTVWSREFSRTTRDDFGRSVIQTSDGGFALAGQTDYFGSGDAWLIKTDAAGNFLWDKTYNGKNSDFAYSIVQTSDDGYALAGQTDYWNNGDVWLIKTDSAGVVSWNQTFGGAGYDRGNSVIKTSDGGYALAGYTNSFSSDGSHEVWLIKLAGTGTPTIKATVDFQPDTLNLESKGKWVTCYVELPEGNDVANINVSTIKLNATVSAELKPTAIGDYDNDAISDLMVKFDRSKVVEYIQNSGSMTGKFVTVTLTITGKLDAGTPFQGSDTIRIIK